MTNEKEKDVETPQIYAAIIGVMNDVGAVGKDATNQQQKYKYRSIDALVSALSPAMAKNGVFVAPVEIMEEIREKQQTRSGSMQHFVKLRIRYRFFASDGSYVDAITIGEAMDTGDKATNKAETAAFKYALSQVFAVPTHDDADATDPEPIAPPENKPAAQNRPTQMHIDALLALAETKGYGEAAVLKSGRIKDWSQLDFPLYTDLSNRLQKLPDKEPEEEIDLGL